MMQLNSASQPSDSRKVVVVMAAGTGGHVIPGIAIAQALAQKNWSVNWLGTPAGIENKLVPNAGFELHPVALNGVRGKGVWGAVRGVYQLLLSVYQSWKLFKRIKPTVLVGMGGYICVPGAWAAKVLGIPLVLVNADAALLLSNKILAKQAKVICCGFDGCAAELPNAHVTGNPVREALLSIAPPPQRYETRQGPLNILVVGGSLGAHVLNEVVPQALALIPAASRPKVLHQTGVKELEHVKQVYSQLGIDAQTVAFIDDMTSAYSQADVLVCRAGAITVSELCAAGIASILVPFLAKTTHHQVGNAHYMASLGAALHIEQSKLSAQLLADQLMTLDRAQLLGMANAAKHAGHPDATQQVIQLIEKVSL